jgi:hypothetical protein
LIRVAAAWRWLLLADVDARPLAALRIAVGVLVLLTLVEYLPVLPRAHSDAGWLPAEVARELMDPLHWSALHWISSPAAVVAFGVVGILAALALTIGWRSRTAAWVCLVVVASIHVRNPALLYGGDSLTRVLLFYTALGRCGAVWSVDAVVHRVRIAREAVAADADALHRPRRFAAPIAVPVWPLRLLQFQVLVIYTFAGIAKLFGRTWAEGTASWYALVNPIYARFDADAMPLPDGMIAILTAATHVVTWWELLWPVMVVAHAWSRRVAMAIGIGVHGGIAVGMQVKWFGIGMLVTYLGFVAPRTYRWLELRVCRRQRRELEARRLVLELDPSSLQQRRVAATVRALDGFALVRLRPTPGAAVSRFVDRDGNPVPILDVLRLLPAMAPLHLAARLPLVGAPLRRAAARLLQLA